MPDLIIPTGFALATWRFTGPPLPHGAATTIGVRLNGAGPVPSTANTIRDAFSSNFFPGELAGIQGAGFTLKFGPNEDGPTVEVPWGVMGAGAATASPNVSFLLQKRTDFGGRRNRGRMYVPGVGEAAIDDAGKLTLAKVSAMQAAADGFVSDLLAATIDPVILHSAAGVAPTTITRIVCSDQAATQRRRLRR